MKVLSLVCFCVSALSAQSADQVSLFSTLPATDKLVVTFSSAGCFHGLTLRFTYSPADNGAFDVDALGSGTLQSLGRVALNPGEAKQLDALLQFYRSKPEGKCTTTEAIHMRQVRGDTVIGEESFIDSSCAADRRPDTLTFMRLALTRVPPKVYGEKTSSSIRVRIWGDGVEREGLHFVEPNASLGDLLAQAGVTEHRVAIHVTRPIIPKVDRYFDFKVDSDEKELAAFRMRTDDDIEIRASKR